MLSIIERFNDEDERCKEEVDDDKDYDNDGDDTNLDNDDDDDGTDFFANEHLKLAA